MLLIVLNVKGLLDYKYVNKCSPLYDRAAEKHQYMTDENPIQS